MSGPQECLGLAGGMGWLPGLADPAYRAFARAFAGILAAVGGALGLLALSGRRGEGLRKVFVAYRAWLVLGPAILLAVGLGREAVILAWTALSLLFVKELARATGLYEDVPFTLAVYAGVLGFGWAAWSRWYGLFMAMPVYATAVLLMIPILRRRPAGSIQRVGLSAIALLYVGWMGGHLGYLANLPGGAGLLLFLILGTELNDAAAYLTGKALGRRPMIPEISPGKTVEGALGGLAAVAAYVALARPWLPGFTAPLLVLTALLLWIGGTVGDLVMSYVKRDLGIKDMGTLIPGHGGLLDRFDSLLFTAPLFLHLARFFVLPGGALS